MSMMRYTLVSLVINLAILISIIPIPATVRYEAEPVTAALELISEELNGFPEIISNSDIALDITNRGDRVIKAKQ